MPLYEYICKDCKKRSELLVTGSKKPACPRCGSKKLDKQLSSFSARVADGSSGAPACSSGACPAPSSCSTGACPFA